MKAHYNHLFGGENVTSSPSFTSGGGLHRSTTIAYWLRESTLEYYRINGVIKATLNTQLVRFNTTQLAKQPKQPKQTNATKATQCNQSNQSNSMQLNATKSNQSNQSKPMQPKQLKSTQFNSTQYILYRSVPTPHHS